MATEKLPTPKPSTPIATSSSARFDPAAAKRTNAPPTMPAWTSISLRYAATSQRQKVFAGRVSPCVHESRPLMIFCELLAHGRPFAPHIPVAPGPPAGPPPPPTAAHRGPADGRQRREPDPAGGRVRRARAHRQTHAPARLGRPGRRRLPTPDERAAHPAGLPPSPRARDLPRRPLPDPPGLPRRAGRPVRRTRTGPQRRGPVEHLQRGRRRRPLRAEDHDIKDEDVARLCSLKDRHINFQGRYLFRITASGSSQDLRPFRDPDAVEDDEDRRPAHPTAPATPCPHAGAWHPTCCDAFAADITASRVQSPGRGPWIPRDPDRRPGQRPAGPLRPGGCWSWMP